jgi:hypothetical protein
VVDIYATPWWRGHGTLRAVTLRGEPTWGRVAATASGPTSERATGSADVPSSSDGVGAEVGEDASLEDLEQEVYTARELHGDEREQVGRLLADARAGMSEPTYRRALALARDSALLSVEECLNGALAMEWEPMPRPEFSLATIEAAVAEQEGEGEGGNR